VKAFLAGDVSGAAAPYANAGVRAQERQNMGGKPKSAAPVKVPPSSVLAPYPYSLYLGSFQNLDQAKKAIALHSGKGLSLYWTRVDFKEKGLWFRVFCGHFRSYEEAESFARERGINEAKVKKTPYANLIGLYAQGPELQEEMKKVSALGFSPYVLPEPDGRLRLFVGAYVTESGAESQSDKLKSRGIHTQVIKR
jgi:hypothetical protein